MNAATRRSYISNAAPEAGHALKRRVLQGLRAGEFCVAYQGIYRVDTSELSQMEALIRWRHPEFGVLLPGSFHEALEDDEVVVELTDFVMNTVSRDIAALQARGVCYPVAINVPPSVASSDGFGERLETVCDAHGITPDLIELELSESQDLARFPSMPRVVQRLRNRGVGVAMDDFGTGFACLSALGPIDFSTVKIAKELLAEAPRCPNARMVFSSVLALLTRLNVKIVVEGVETPAQAQWLAQWPQALAQGFYLARPVFGMGNVPGVRASMRGSVVTDLHLATAA
ncbi:MULTISPECIES: EAL domain-containing protein [unclassified Caballeronia]|uniref:EAL domain-containing protein n=1 Tax=unclassified Caballeronia TaxID=2646786 RepID=UPI00285EEDCD|nr:MULTISPECIES: EAL domain-containing protein [unclassified Caballeronia]MDR5740747.1 EAL domain-containing protein [Caballeronia sp. LZ016]MDR5808730.1 EAL domain-containing protein [Caballeronia sp. LZ019]